MNSYMNIVIVDDEQDIGFILSFELKFSGHSAVFFDQVEAAQKHLIDNIKTTDVIICDFQMPRMNGLELFQWAKSNNFHGPFYILTGEPTMDTVALEKLGITKVLFKPQDLNKLPELLKI